MPQPSLWWASSPPWRANAASDARASVGTRLDMANSSHMGTGCQARAQQPLTRIKGCSVGRRRVCCMTNETLRFNLELEQQQGFEFLVRFDWPVAELKLDEPEPLGKRAGPNAARL